MSIKETIETKLANALDLKHLEVINESGSHNVPPGSESHFKVVLVSDDFWDKKLVERHRAVNKALAEELDGPVHALAIHAYTGDEWRKRRGDAPMSPPCMGGSKHAASDERQ
jgi:stress-induced morphogen